MMLTIVRKRSYREWLAHDVVSFLIWWPASTLWLMLLQAWGWMGYLGIPSFSWGQACAAMFMLDVLRRPKTPWFESPKQ